MVGGGLVIVDYLLRNRKKFPSLSPYVWNKLEEQEWMSKIVDDNFYVILETLLEIKSPKIKKMIIKSCDYIMSMVLICDHKELLNKIMNSYVREDFSVKYREIKSQTLKHSMSLDTNKATEFIIEKYPELIEHKDIELFMMNGNSLNIAKLIKSKRDFTKEEIKEAFLRLSTSEICVLRLLVDVPDIDYRMFTLKEALKISNQLYEDKAYGEIDYSYDGWYMNFNRNVLLKNKDFNKNMEKIRGTILDEKMYSLLEKEQLKMNFEEKFPSKPVIKKLKL